MTKRPGLSSFLETVTGLNEHCLVCNAYAKTGNGILGKQYACRRCGWFEIATGAKALLRGRFADDAKAWARASHYIRTHSTETEFLQISIITVGVVADAKLPAFAHQETILLRWLAEDAGDDVHHASEPDDLSLAGLVGVVLEQNLESVFASLERKGLIESVPDNCYKLTDEGWTLLQAAEAPTHATVQLAQPVISTPTPQAVPPTYIDEERLADLRRLPQGTWDFRRLIRLCEELDDAWRGGRLLTVAALVRAIVDHVPPVFNAPNFQSCAALQTRSTKASFENLQNSLRNISDGVLHQQIRRADTLPSRTQVDFRQDLDVVLSEVIRISSAS